MSLIVLLAATVGLVAGGYWMGKRLPGMAVLGIVAVAVLAVIVGFEPIRRSADREFQDDDDWSGPLRAIGFAWLLLVPCVGLSVGGMRAALRRAREQETR